MTNQNTEILELAKECAILEGSFGLAHTLTLRDKDILAFASALRSQDAARVAMLVDALSLTKNRVMWLLETTTSPAKWVANATEEEKALFGFGCNRWFILTDDSSRAIRFDSQKSAEDFAAEYFLASGEWSNTPEWRKLAALEHVFMQEPATDTEKFERIKQILFAAQPSAAEYVAEVEARALEEAAEILSCGADWELHIPILRRMAAEKRKQAEQAEGKGEK